MLPRSLDDRRIDDLVALGETTKPREMLVETVDQVLYRTSTHLTFAEQPDRFGNWHRLGQEEVK